MAILAIPLVIARGCAFASFWLLPARRVTDPWAGFGLVWLAFLGFAWGYLIIIASPGWIASRVRFAPEWCGFFTMIALAAPWCASAYVMFLWIASA